MTIFHGRFIRWIYSIADDEWYVQIWLTEQRYVLCARAEWLGGVHEF